MKETQISLPAIRAGYSLEISDLQFLLRGFGGDCYRAETANGESFFLKLHDPVTNQMVAASSRAFYLPLLAQLHIKSILPNIPHPLPTRDGNLSLAIGENELVITNFIEGELVGFGGLPDAILTELARQVGILHNCRPQLEFEHPFIDQFEIVFENDLPQSFQVLNALDKTASPEKLLLREIILPRQGEITTALKKLKKLQTYARASTKPKVICHTDIHGGNLMTDAAGQLYLLDWENALIAPPEHDLTFFAAQPNFWEIFWPPYARHFPAVSLDPQLLAFYFYRRALEDITDFILRILRGESGPERDQQQIRWTVESLDGISQIENTIRKIQAHIG